MLNSLLRATVARHSVAFYPSANSGMESCEAGRQLHEFIVAVSAALDGGGVARGSSTLSDLLASNSIEALSNTFPLICDSLSREDLLACDSPRYKALTEQACELLRTCEHCAALYCKNPSERSCGARSGRNLIYVGTGSIRYAVCLWKGSRHHQEVDGDAALVQVAGGLLSKCCSLLEILIQFAEVVMLSDGNGQDYLEPVCAALADFVRCAHDVGTFDVKLMVAVCKFVVRMCSKFKEACCRWVAGSDIVAVLGRAICANIYALAADVQITGVKLMKLLAFQVKVMCRVVDDLSSIVYREPTSSTALLDVAMQLQRVFPPYDAALHCSLYSSGSAESAATFAESVREHVADPVRQLLAAVISPSSDLASSAAACTRLASVENGKHLEALKLCMKIVEAIAAGPEPLQSKWIAADSGHDLLESIFSCLQECSWQVAFATVESEDATFTDQGNPHYFYHDLYATLCHLVSQVPAVSARMEEWLLKCIMSGQPYCALLAADVWNFMARTLFSSDSVYSHCCLLADLHLMVINDVYPFIGHTLQQLLHALPEDMQASFIARISRPDYLPVWRCIPCAMWKLASVSWEASVACVQASYADYLSNQAGAVSFDHLPACMASLMGSFGQRDSADEAAACSRPLFQVQNLATCWTQMLPSPLAARDDRFCAATEAALIGLLLCSPALTIGNENPQLMQILRLCLAAFDKCTSTCKAAMCHWLESMSDRVIQPLEEQTKICELVSRLLTRLIECSDCGPVRVAALQAFKVFAERTPHANIVADATEQSDHVKNAVVQFLTMEGDLSSPSSDLAELWSAEMTCFRRKGSTAGGLGSNQFDDTTRNSEKVRKRKINGVGILQSVARSEEEQPAGDAAAVLSSLQHALRRVRSAGKSFTPADLQRISSACQALMEVCSAAVATGGKKDRTDAV